MERGDYKSIVLVSSYCIGISSVLLNVDKVYKLVLCSADSSLKVVPLKKSKTKSVTLTRPTKPSGTVPGSWKSFQGNGTAAPGPTAPNLVEVAKEARKWFV